MKFQFNKMQDNFYYVIFGIVTKHRTNSGSAQNLSREMEGICTYSEQQKQFMNNIENCGK
jgi:hypothetical protein